MNPNSLTTTDASDGVIVRTTAPSARHSDYSWFFVALLALVLLASGLREVFGNKKHKKE